MKVRPKDACRRLLLRREQQRIDGSPITGNHRPNTLDNASESVRPARR